MRSIAGLTALLVAAVTTAGVAPWVIGLLQRFSVVDKENGRTSHRGTVPRGGGLAVLIGLIVALGATGPQWFERPLDLVALFALAFAVLGLIDDVRTLPALLRLGTQAILTTLFLVASGISLFPDLGAVSWVLTAFWILGFVNAFNFMDGINGISSATTVLVGASVALASWRWDGGVEIPALALVGGAIGFAPFNALTGRVFLGDVGSYLLGGGLALLAVAAIHNGVPALPVLLPCLVYVADVAYTMAMRASRGEKLLKSHRQHVYQRLTNTTGWSHLRTTSVVALFTFALAGLGQLAADAPLLAQAVAVIVGLVLVAAYLQLPRLAGSRALTVRHTRSVI